MRHDPLNFKQEEQEQEKNRYTSKKLQKTTKLEQYKRVMKLPYLPQDYTWREKPKSTRLFHEYMNTIQVRM